MSLINEALKRAKEAQAKAPPPGGSMPHLRPVEPSPTGLRGAGLLLPVVLALAVLGGLLFLWQAAPKNMQVRAANGAPLAGTATNPLEGRARSPLRAAAGLVAGNAVAAANAQRRAEDSAPYPSGSAPAIATSATNAPEVAAVSSAASAPASAVAAGAGTNLASPPVPPVSAPALPRLQAIVFSPARPSAMIGGKTLFVGDRIGALRVLAIGPQSVTLAGAKGTNVLSLAE